MVKFQGMNLNILPNKMMHRAVLLRRLFSTICVTKERTAEIRRIVIEVDGNEVEIDKKNEMKIVQLSMKAGETF